jgi:hypothetical protein
MFFSVASGAVFSRGVNTARLSPPINAPAMENSGRQEGECGGASGGSSAPDGFGDIDPMEAARASAASAAVMAYYGALIAEISSNPGLSPTQKGAAITALRQKMKAAAREASQAIMCAAQNAAQARRRMLKGRNRLI